jgi:LCP family protein required for cell wall assembly
MARSIAAAIAGLVLVSSGWGWHLVQVAEASVSRTDALPASGNADVNGATHAGAEMNLLLVGMDSRDGLTAQQQQELSTGNPDEVLNTDSMMLVHVPADGSAASFVSLPRDTYVSIPGYGEARLNSAYSRGYNAAQGSDADKDAAGAQLLIQTVSQFTGLRIDHFAEIDLLGFINLSDIVGGVTVNLCRATKDSYSGANFPAGVQTISGGDALKFVRQRHGLPHYDLDRVVRQQVYIAGMLRNILSSDLLLDPSKQQEVVEQVGSSVTFDQGLDIFDLATQMQDVQPGNITFQTVPGLTDARINGADVLRPPSQDVLNTFFASLTAPPVVEPTPAAPTTTAAPTTAPPAPAPAPSAVTVSVFNGSGVNGAAASAAAALTALGFKAGSGGNAASAATTTVRHHAGDEAAGALVASRVPGAPVVVDNSVPTGTVLVVIGTQYQGIATAAAVTTTAPASSSAPAVQERTATDTSCIY